MSDREHTGRKIWRAVYPILIQVLVIGLAADAMLFFGKKIPTLSGNPYLLTNLNALAAAAVSVPIGIWLYKKDRLRRQEGRTFLEPTAWWEPGLLLLMGAAAGQYLNMLVNLIRLRDLFPYSGYSGQGASLGQFWLGVLCVGIAAPVAEEIIFRGLVLGRLKEFLSPGWGILLSSLLFGIYHGNMVQFVYAFLLGLFLGWAAEVNHSLAAPVLIHGAANIWALFLDRWGSTLLQAGGGHIFQGILIAGAFFLLCGLYYLMKKTDNPNFKR